MSKNMYELYQDSPREKLSNAYIEEVLDLLLDEELYPYVENLIISQEKSDSFGKYSFDTRTITVHKKEMEDRLRGIPFCASLQAIQTIKNGIEHARNYKTLEEGKGDIESTIVSHSLRDVAIGMGLVKPTTKEFLDPFYTRIRIRDNLETNPGDRLAQIRSWKYMANLLKNQKNTPEQFNARAMVQHSLKRGYKDNGYYIEAPALRFLLDTRMLEEFYQLKKRLEKQEYSLNTRLLYGLPLTREEYEEKVYQKKRS